MIEADLSQKGFNKKNEIHCLWSTKILVLLIIDLINATHQSQDFSYFNPK